MFNKIITSILIFKTLADGPNNIQRDLNINSFK